MAGSIRLDTRRHLHRHQQQCRNLRSARRLHRYRGSRRKHPLDCHWRIQSPKWHQHVGCIHQRRGGASLFCATDNYRSPSSRYFVAHSNGLGRCRPRHNVWGWARQLTRRIRRVIHALPTIRNTNFHIKRPHWRCCGWQHYDRNTKCHDAVVPMQQIWRNDDQQTV